MLRNTVISTVNYVRTASLGRHYQFGINYKNLKYTHSKIICNDLQKRFCTACTHQQSPVQTLKSRVAHRPSPVQSSPRESPIDFQYSLTSAQIKNSTAIDNLLVLHTIMWRSTLRSEETENCKLLQLQYFYY